MQSEIESASTSKTMKLMNAQTQHGSEATADEENIVLLATSFSPVRETSDEVVWHEDFEHVSFFFSKNIEFPIIFDERLLQDKLFAHKLLREKPDLNESILRLFTKGSRLRFVSLSVRYD